MSQEVTMKLEQMIAANEAERKERIAKLELTKIKIGISFAAILVVSSIGLCVAFAYSLSSYHFRLPEFLTMDDHYPKSALIERPRGYESYVYVDEDRAHYPQGF